MGQPIERSAKKNVFVEKYDEVTSFDGSKCSTRPQLFLKNGGFLGLKHSRRCHQLCREKREGSDSLVDSVRGRGIYACTLECSDFEFFFKMEKNTADMELHVNLTPI